MKIKYYEVYDSCYRGNIGSDMSGFPVGSSIFRTTDINKAQRIIDVMNPIAKSENQFTLDIGEKVLVIDENEINLDSMTDEEIVSWIKSSSKKRIL